MRNKDKAVWKNRIGLGLVVLASIGALASPQARADDDLDSIILPPVPATPWLFQEFPIIAWWGPAPGIATLSDYQTYRDAGFNLALTNPQQGYFEALDLLDRVGLKSMSFMHEMGWGEPIPGFVPPVGHPAIAGFLVGDEPENGPPMIDAITVMNEQMRLDPSRWTFFNLLPPNLQGRPQTVAAIRAAARNGMPIVSFDDYVLLDDGRDLTEQYYTNLATVRTASLASGVPFWAFGLTVRHAGYMGWYRRPSESDIRWNQFSNLAYGAKGLWYFTYWGFDGFPHYDKNAIVSETGAKTDLYDQVRAINHTVKAVGPTLLSLRSEDVVHTNPPPGQKQFTPGEWWISDLRAKDVLVGFFSHPSGDRYALVVNKRHGKGYTAAAMTDDITLKFQSGITAVEAVSWLDGRVGALNLVDGGTVLSIAGGTGVLLRVGPARDR